MIADCASRLLSSLAAGRQSIRAELMYIKANAVNLISGIARAVMRARWFGLTTIKLDKVMLFEGQWLPMTGSQSIAITTALGLGLAFVPVAWADPASDACAALADARSALYSMINAKDKSVQDALNAKVQAASAKLDSVLAGMTGPETKVAADFKAVWDQFKATREKEIIPAIYKGNAAEAKKITDGIQYERLSKMWSIMTCR